MALVVQPPPRGPWGMVELFPDEQAADSHGTKAVKPSLASSAVGRAALMQAYACIGIDAETSKLLIAGASAPPKPTPPVRESNAAPVQRLEAKMSDASGPAVAASAAGDGSPPSGLQAALLAAAATNSDPQNTMALFAAATAAKSAADVDAFESRPPIPESETAPLPIAEVKDALHLAASSDSTAQLSGDLRSVDSMEASKAKEEAQAAVAPMAGYARAAMTSRIAENLSKAAASATVAPFSLNSEKLREGGSKGGAKVFIGGIPRGTSEGLILLECRKLGNVIDLFYDTNANSLFESSWALITFSREEEAHTAVKRLGQRVALFGATEPLEVRFGSHDDDDRMEHVKLTFAQHQANPGAPDNAGTSGKKNKKNKKRSRSGKDSKKRSRSRRRRRDKRRRKKSSTRSSGSGSTDAEDQAPQKRPAPTPVPPEKHKIRGSGGFDSVASTELAATTAQTGPAPVQVPSNAEMPVGGRQVGVRGNWAEFATTAGRNYYVNVITGEKTWARPVDYNTPGSQRSGAQVSANGIPTGHSNLFVGGIPPNCTDAIFRQMFGSFGTVISIKCVPEKSHGFVKYSNCAEAQKAIDTMNGAMINGTPLNVKFANMAAH